MTSAGILNAGLAVVDTLPAGAVIKGGR